MSSISESYRYIIRSPDVRGGKMQEWKVRELAFTTSLDSFKRARPLIRCTKSNCQKANSDVYHLFCLYLSDRQINIDLRIAGVGTVFTIDFKIRLIGPLYNLVIPDAFPDIDDDSRNCSKFRGKNRILRIRNSAPYQASRNTRERIDLGA